MRIISANQMVKITIDMYKRYIEPLACSFMYGEVPTSTIVIHRAGSYDHDWLTKVRFKNSVSISMFRCEVYLHDLAEFCRYCRMWLLTETVFRVVVTYTMLFPLYQSQYLNFETYGVEKGYDMMMTEAGNDAYEFMLQHFHYEEEHFEKVILHLIHYYGMIINQTFKYFPDKRDILEDVYELEKIYERHMLQHHYRPYQTARHWKARDYLLDENGFMLLEPLEKHTNPS